MYTPIYSEQDLQLVLFRANEGICTNGISVFEGVITGKEFAENFTEEESSDSLNEYQKRQRDLEKGRAQGLIKYFDNREDTVLPSITVFVSSLKLHEEISIGNKEVVTATLESSSDRLVCDGQNRLNLFKDRVTNTSPTQYHTLGVKFIVTNTDTLEPVTQKIRQVFSDYHLHLRKPTSAQNLFFDSSQSFSRLIRDQILDNVLVDGHSLKRFISTTGKPKKSQLMDLKQLGDFICTALGTTPVKMNKLLEGSSDTEAEIIRLTTPFLTKFFSLIPMRFLSDSGPNVMYTKSIFWKGTAIVIRSIFEEHLSRMHKAPIDWSVLDGIVRLPVKDITHDFWLENNVVQKSISRNGSIKYRMIRSSERSCATAICKELELPSVGEEV
ncbi:DGQHR domain-containing protein [Vibrio alginolyticus]|uniref:DGQHR domain-containing protein n=1 Tax=Vibrio alginolyticus TaxID=663 RepID=UPI002F4097FD